MAVIHNTTMTPGKLELLAAWLPSRPWYAGGGRDPEPTKAGGFRLDDPDGEVGIEFMVVNDGSTEPPVSYLVPLGYRGAPLDGAEHALIGTSEHGVLGRRWVYDGMHDPVVVAQLLALLQGRAEPQQQSVNDTPDPSVTVHFTCASVSAVAGSAVVTDRPESTDLLMETTADDDGRRRTVIIEVSRVLRPGSPAPGAGQADATVTYGHVAAPWRLPNGDEARGLVATLRDT